MADLEVELEERANPDNNQDIESDNASHSNAEELVSFVVSNNKNNNNSTYDNYHNNNRQQLAKTGQDYVNDGDVGVPTKHSNIPGATINFVNSMFRHILSTNYIYFKIINHHYSESVQELLVYHLL